ncbi:MAG: TolC family protein [Gemmatimonadales bacterium]
MPRLLVAVLVAIPTMGEPAHAQADSLAGLLALAGSVNPSIKAANDLAVAARARVRSAGARPDPMLMLGAINVPVSSLNFSDEDMTMKMVGIGQNLPYPGKLALRRRISELQAVAAEAASDGVRLAVVRDIKTAWYELEYTHAALEVARRNGAILAGVSNVATARYSTGVGMQQEVLRATLEATRLNESANALLEGRAAVAARINELLDRPTETPVPKPLLSPVMLRAAVDSGSSSGFVSRELGATVAGSPLPALAELQTLAVEINPNLRAKAAMVAASKAELELARKEYLPDIDVSLQYGQRSGSMMTPEGDRTPRSDMISAVVSIPIPIQRKNKQSAEVAATRATASSVLSEQRAAQNQIRAEVARLYSDISHQRTLLALFVRAVIPQGRASVAAAMANYQAGRGDLTSLLAAQTAVFDLELGYQRALADFGQKMAELESVVGKELIP